MQFSTKVAIPPSPFLITHRDKMLMMGSCFTENMGAFLQRTGFRVCLNPFGILYNPFSIFTNLERIIAKREYTEDELTKYRELFCSLDHHGSFSGTDKKRVLEIINSELRSAHDHFNTSQYIFLTPGTSFVYTHLDTKRIAANCHKIPGSSFEKRLLGVEEIVHSFRSVQPLIKNKTVVFTVSPVRHWRDGAVENLRSKSILIESIHRIIGENENCHYFPAYEIVMDELRDYRFYGEDMLHPNEVAVKYIWEKFSETYLSAATQELNKKIEKIRVMTEHRVKHGNTSEEVAFRKQLSESIEAIKKDHPDIGDLFSAGSSITTGNSI